MLERGVPLGVIWAGPASFFSLEIRFRMTAARCSPLYLGARRIQCAIATTPQMKASYSNTGG